VLFVSIDLTKVQQDLRKDKDKKRRLLKKKVVFLKAILASFLIYDLIINFLDQSILFFIC